MLLLFCSATEFPFWVRFDGGSGLELVKRRAAA
jgi:hypothetical protein